MAIYPKFCYFVTDSKWYELSLVCGILGVCSLSHVVLLDNVVLHLSHQQRHLHNALGASQVYWSNFFSCVAKPIAFQSKWKCANQSLPN